jgi:phage terminase large subunit
MPAKTKKRPTRRVIEHRYSPRGACKEIFHRKEDEVLISGPAGTGKSRACLEKILMVCLATPNVRALICRKTLSSLGSTALVTWRNYVAKEALAVGDVHYYGGSAQEAPQYRFKNGSTISIGGMNHPDRIMSSEYDIIYVQEATELTITDLEALITRLRNWQIGFQQLLMDCNPAGETHWLKLRCNNAKTVLIESRHEDNPVLFDEITMPDGSVTYKLTEKGTVYIGKLDNLTGVRKARLRHGKWVSAEGQIYEEFDPAYHVLQWDYDEEGNRLPLPEEWERYWVIDFGIVHPFVCKWYAVDEEGIAYMYREIYMTDRTINEHAVTIMEQVTKEVETSWYDHINRVHHTRKETVWTEPKPRAIICDHDLQARRTFEKATGLGTTPAIKDVFEGINLTKDRWKLNDAKESRLYYMEDTLVERDQNLADKLMPTCSLEEFPCYVWKKNPDGKIKQEPVKEFDDGMDTDRYFVMHHDFKGRARATILG